MRGSGPIQVLASTTWASLPKISTSSRPKSTSIFILVGTLGIRAPRANFRCPIAPRNSDSLEGRLPARGTFLQNWFFRHNDIGCPCHLRISMFSGLVIQRNPERCQVFFPRCEVWVRCGAVLLAGVLGRELLITKGAVKRAGAANFDHNFPLFDQTLEDVK